MLSSPNQRIIVQPAAPNTYHNTTYIHCIDNLGRRQLQQSGVRDLALAAMLRQLTHRWTPTREGMIHELLTEIVKL